MILCQETARSFVEMVWAKRNRIAPLIISFIVLLAIVLVMLTSIKQHFAEFGRMLSTLPL